MLFETITLTTFLLAKALFAKKNENQLSSELSESSTLDSITVPENTARGTPILNECKMERRNELFLSIFSILSTANKNDFKSLLQAFKCLKDIYDPNSEEDSEKISDAIVKDFRGFFANAKNGECIIERFKCLKEMLEFSFRTTKSDCILIHYYKDMGMDLKYVEKVNADIKKCFAPITCDISNKSLNSNTIDSDKTDFIKNYQCLLGAAGIVYDDLVDVLNRYQLMDTRGHLNFDLLYVIAEISLNSSQFYFTKGLTPNRLAKDITDSIIHYLHNDIEPDERIKVDHGGSPEKYVAGVIERYLLNREIKSYYYFLKMACKVLEMLERLYAIGNNDCNEKMIFPSDSKEIIKIAKKQLKQLKLPILMGMDENEIIEDIEKAFLYKDAQLPKKIKGS